MEKRKLGTIEVSKIGMGTMAFFPRLWENSGTAVQHGSDSGSF